MLQYKKTIGREEKEIAVFLNNLHVFILWSQNIGGLAVSIKVNNLPDAKDVEDA